MMLMKEIFDYVKARYVSEKGQGMVEYALILAFVVLIAAALMNSDGIKGGIEAVFGSVSSKLKAQ